jgi:hypothetical protein
MRWHTFLWDFQSLRWCSREQYPSDPHAAHFCFAASEQDGSAHCMISGFSRFAIRLRFLYEPVLVNWPLR